MIPGGQALRKRIERIDLESFDCNAQSFRVVHIHAERAREVIVATCHSTVCAGSRVVDTLVAGHIRDKHALDIIRNFVSLRGAVGTGQARGERNPAAEVVNRHCREVPRQLIFRVGLGGVLFPAPVLKLDLDRIRRGCRLEVRKLKLVGVDVFADAVHRAVRVGQPSVCRIGLIFVDRHRHTIVVDAS